MLIYITIFHGTKLIVISLVIMNLINIKKELTNEF